MSHESLLDSRNAVNIVRLRVRGKNGIWETRRNDKNLNYTLATWWHVGLRSRKPKTRRQRVCREW